jgi:tetratricopeptide (TPR) repeat protein
MSLLFAILAQIGPFQQPGVQPVSPLPPEIVERQRQERERERQELERERQTRPAGPPAADRPSEGLAACLALLKTNPAAAEASARDWFERMRADEKANAGQCLGMALARLERWEEAESTLLAARDAAGEGNHARRARLAAMAGNAALARGDAESALADFEAARADAAALGDRSLTGVIAIDRARALVALGRQVLARASLAEARNASPGNAQAWLFSAALSRRMDEIDMAQVLIEEAARLAPTDPEIGLEAGVIAMLAGREASARKSWQSVLDTAPESDAANRARAYLAQIGEEEASTP